MRIIVEGPDGVGKSTIVELLADHFGCDILHLTERGSKVISDYLDKAQLNNIVSDRSFLSEVAYSMTFNRKGHLTIEQCTNLIKAYRKLGWKIILLDAPTKVIVDRLNLRGDEDEYKINNIAKLRTTYLGLAHAFDLPVIDAEKASIDDIIKQLEDMK